MQIVIKLSEKDFYRICQEYLSFTDTLEGRALSAISNGVVLPENCDLINRNDIIV